MANGNDQQWPGTKEEYRELRDQANTLLASDDPATKLAGATLMQAAMVAGLSQVVDKIAYQARKS